MSGATDRIASLERALVRVSDEAVVLWDPMGQPQEGMGGLCMAVMDAREVLVDQEAKP